MKYTTLLHEASVSIRGNRLRTLLAMLGIIIGVASVVAMVAIGEGSREVVKNAIASLGTDMIIVTSGKDKQRGVSGVGSITFEAKDPALLEQSPSILSAAASTDLHNSNFTNGHDNATTNLMGITSNFFSVYNWQFDEGASFTADQMQLHRHVVIIGQTIVNKLFKQEIADGQKIVGENILYGQEKYRVVGILKKKGKDLRGFDQDDIVFIPLSTAETFFGTPEAWGDSFIVRLYVRALGPDAMDEAKEDIVATLRQRQHLHETTADNFSADSVSSLTEVENETSEAMSLLLGAIASISLAVGGIGITNIMLVNVTERTREIGIRKAIGATNHDILMQFLLEAIIITSVGCLLGLAVGFSGAWAAMEWLDLAVLFNGWPVILAVGMTVVVGLASGLYPAYKAAKLQPIEALRA